MSALTRADQVSVSQVSHEVCLKGTSVYTKSIYVVPKNLNQDQVQKTLTDIVDALKLEVVGSSYDAEKDTPRGVLKHKNILILRNSQHARVLDGVDLFSDNIIRRIPKNLVFDVTLLEAGREYVAALRKLVARATDRTLQHPGMNYDLGPAYMKAKRNEHAYLLSCGHSIDKAALFKALGISNSGDKKVKITSDRVHCHVCKLTVTSAEPNLPLQQISRRFIRFVEPIKEAQENESVVLPKQPHKHHIKGEHKKEERKPNPFYYDYRPDPYRFNPAPGTPHYPWEDSNRAYERSFGW